MTGGQYEGICLKLVSIVRFNGTDAALLSWISDNVCSNHTSPPQSRICCLMAVMICGNLLVPM